MKIHTNDKHFQCKHCNYKSVKKYNVEKHIRSVHNDLNVSIGKTIRKPRKDPKNLSKSYLRRKSKKVLIEIKEATSTNDFLRITTVKNVARQNDDVKVVTLLLRPIEFTAV